MIISSFCYVFSIKTLSETWVSFVHNIVFKVAKHFALDNRYIFYS